MLLAFLATAGALVVQNFDERTPAPQIQAEQNPAYADVLENISTTTSEIPIATTTPKEIPISAPEETPVSVDKPTLPIPAPIPVPPPTPPNWDKVNEQTREALVNILCVAKNGDIFQPLSGSGIFVDPRGVILTNAHVAQYLLLTEGGEKSDLLDCVIRTGSPAVNRYRATPLFISPRWIADNAKNILEENARERGEYDYALLVVTGMTNPNAALPSSFPFVPLQKSQIAPDTQDAFLAAGYPAGFLGGIAVQRELWSVSSFATIQSRYSFEGGALDLIGLGGNLLAQKGASGGALVDGSGEVVGLITTAIVEGNTDERDVRALTADYISRAFAEEAGFSLFSLKDADPSPLLAQFSRDIAPALRTQLTDAIYKTND